LGIEKKGTTFNHAPNETYHGPHKSMTFSHASSYIVGIWHKASLDVILKDLDDTEDSLFWTDLSIEIHFSHIYLEGYRIRHILIYLVTCHNVEYTVHL
jgi:hypothetical protein